MGFDVTADAYASFMGRFSQPLAQQLVDLIGPTPGDQALDVGCGPGTLTAVLADRLGADHVSAVDPSPSFVPAVRALLPDVDVREGAAEEDPNCLRKRLHQFGFTQSRDSFEEHVPFGEKANEGLTDEVILSKDPQPDGFFDGVGRGGVLVDVDGFWLGGDVGLLGYRASWASRSK